jgi:hypothetical protein
MAARFGFENHKYMPGLNIASTNLGSLPSFWDIHSSWIRQVFQFLFLLFLDRKIESRLLESAMIDRNFSWMKDYTDHFKLICWPILKFILNKISPFPLIKNLCSCVQLPSSVYRLRCNSKVLDQVLKIPIWPWESRDEMIEDFVYLLVDWYYNWQASRRGEKSHSWSLPSWTFCIILKN